MAAGTPTLSDSFWLGQSAVFKNRVDSSLWQQCQNIENEAVSGVTGTMPFLVHQARANFVKTVQNPASYSNWLLQFVRAAANDPTLIGAATVAATNYAPITTAAQGDTAAADGQTPVITTAMINNAVSAAFNTLCPGI